MDTTNELTSLIKLLDEPDPTIYRDIEKRILSYGNEARDLLKKTNTQITDQVCRRRIHELLSKINLHYIKQELLKWKNSNDKDLLTGMLLIAEYRYPEIDKEKIHKEIDLIRKDIWLELNDNITALEKVKIFNHVIFDIHGFKANKQNFYAPENSYINDLLDFKQGNPISLSILYSVLAQKLDVPVYGVNLPEHFILAYVNTPTPQAARMDDILFYLNAFNSGIVFTQKEIQDFLAKIQITPQDYHFLPCSNVVILQRVINNLIHSYHQIKQQEKVIELDNLNQILQMNG
ncbi:MAG: transglutaminase-like domain-containing protein [Bacteroidales bacterium]